MNIDSIKLPPVSQGFYDTLIEAFPPLNPLDIKKDTSMIEIQRNAAQQEVIKFISNVVRKNVSEESPSFWYKLWH